MYRVTAVISPWLLVREQDIFFFLLVGCCCQAHQLQGTIEFPFLQGFQQIMAVVSPLCSMLLLVSISMCCVWEVRRWPIPARDQQLHLTQGVSPYNFLTVSLNITSWLMWTFWFSPILPLIIFPHYICSIHHKKISLTFWNKRVVFELLTGNGPWPMPNTNPCMATVAMATGRGWNCGRNSRPGVAQITPHKCSGLFISVEIGMLIIPVFNVKKIRTEIP